MTLQEEFALIDAQHAERSFLRAHIEVLTLLLQHERGQLTLKGQWRLKELVERYPILKDL